MNQPKNGGQTAPGTQMRGKQHLAQCPHPRAGCPASSALVGPGATPPRPLAALPGWHTRWADLRQPGAALQRNLRLPHRCSASRSSADTSRRTKVTFRREGAGRGGSDACWVCSGCCAEPGAMRGSSYNARIEMRGPPEAGAFKRQHIFPGVCTFRPATRHRRRHAVG